MNIFRRPLTSIVNLISESVKSAFTTIMGTAEVAAKRESDRLVERVNRRLNAAERHARAAARVYWRIKIYNRQIEPENRLENKRLEKE